MTERAPWQVRLVPRQVDGERLGDGRLLIAFLHGIGDNVMLTPAVRTIKERNPRSSIVMLVRGDTAAREIWEDNPYVSRVVPFRGKQPVYWHPLYQARRFTLARELRAVAAREGADRVAHVTGLTWPTAAMRALGMPHKQRILAMQLGVEPRSFATDLFVRDEHRRVVDEMFAHAGPPTVALNRTSSQHVRFWSLAQYEAACVRFRALGFRVLHCYTRASREMERRNDGRTALRLAGDVSTEDLRDERFLTTAAALERCAAIVSVDSALMHVGIALRKPTVGLFTWPILFNGAPFDRSTVTLHGQPVAQTVVEAVRGLLARADSNDPHA